MELPYDLILTSQRELVDARCRLDLTSDDVHSLDDEAGQRLSSDAGKVVCPVKTFRNRVEVEDHVRRGNTRSAAASSTPSRT